MFSCKSLLELFLGGDFDESGKKRVWVSESEGKCLGSCWEAWGERGEGNTLLPMEVRET
jgi:hypothetical protein